MFNIICLGILLIGIFIGYLLGYFECSRKFKNLIDAFENETNDNINKVIDSFIKKSDIK